MVLKILFYVIYNVNSWQTEGMFVTLGGNYSFFGPPHLVLSYLWGFLIGAFISYIVFKHGKTRETLDLVLLELHKLFFRANNGNNMMFPRVNLCCCFLKFNHQFYFLSVFRKQTCIIWHSDYTKRLKHCVVWSKRQFVKTREILLLLKT